LRPYSAAMEPRVTITLPDAGLRPLDYRALMGASPLPLAVIDRFGRFAEANHAFADLLGSTIARLRDQPAHEVVHPDDHGALDDALQPMLAGPAASGTAHLRLVNSFGESRQTVAHLSATRTGAGVHVLLAAVDQSREHAQLSQLAYVATHDPLTGLLNRAGLVAQLQTLLSEGTEASVALLDLDKLKPVNDAYGHAAGDQLLRQVARALSDLAAPDGLAARLAGDEFVVIADTTDEVALGQFLTEQLARLQVEVAPGVVLRPTASVGISPVRGGLTVSQVLATADDSMYLVKRRRQEAFSPVS
jgi:diguanylate cyclase (GGDEF)-like protein/PAS domain S-box-containing protein